MPRIWPFSPHHSWITTIAGTGSFPGGVTTYAVVGAPCGVRSTRRVSGSLHARVAAAAIMTAASAAPRSGRRLMRILCMAPGPNSSRLPTALGRVLGTVRAERVTVAAVGVLRGVVFERLPAAVRCAHSTAARAQAPGRRGVTPGPLDLVSRQGGIELSDLALQL